MQPQLGGSPLELVRNPILTQRLLPPQSGGVYHWEKSEQKPN